RETGRKRRSDSRSGLVLPGAVAIWKTGFFEMPDRQMIGRPNITIGAGCRQIRSQRIAPVSPNEIVGAGELRDAHPNQGCTVGVPFINVEQKGGETVSASEAEIAA